MVATGVPDHLVIAREVGKLTIEITELRQEVRNEVNESKQELKDYLEKQFDQMPDRLHDKIVDNIQIQGAAPLIFHHIESLTKESRELHNKRTDEMIQPLMQLLQGTAPRCTSGISSGYDKSDAATAESNEKIFVRGTTMANSQN